jgi:hypothetical protein
VRQSGRMPLPLVSAAFSVTRSLVRPAYLEQCGAAHYLTLHPHPVWWGRLSCFCCAN